MIWICFTIFWISLLACFYIYVGYPALLWLLSRLRPRPVRRAAVFPSVSLIVAAYNEEQVIEAKIRNSRGLDYPADKLEIVVVSDGSTDSTEEIVRRWEDRGVRLLTLPRGGKAFALNAGAKHATGEILVFTDANSELDRSALASLAENFADPEVGGVCGNKKIRPSVEADTTAEGEDLYWRFDKWQKRMESRLGSIFAADGTLYAVRKSLYVPIEDPAQADDIAISTRVVLQGYRLLYDPRAIAWEEAPVEGRQELRRKVRVTNHSVRALLKLKGALLTSGFYSIELLSHKLVRHLVPFFLIPLLVSSFCLVPVHLFYAMCAGVQVLFYFLAVLGYLLRGSRWARSRLFTVPYYFSLVNAAAFLGVVSLARGQRLAAWTPRQGLDG